MTAHSNLAVSTYRIAIANRQNSKKYSSLMTTAYLAVHHNVERIDDGNRAILNYMNVRFHCTYHYKFAQNLVSAAASIDPLCFCDSNGSMGSHQNSKSE